MGYFAPASLDDALSVLDRGDASIVAGGTDFFPGLAAGKRPRSILDPTGIEALKGIARTPGGWRIGAAATWSDIASEPLPACFDALKEAGREVGSIQIQNAGTVAGNLCNASPAADGVPPLLALNAEVEIASAAGTRRVALGDFITGVRAVDLRPGELVAAIHVPSVASEAASSFLKLGSRRYLVISIAMVAVVARTGKDGIIVDVRVAVGSCSAVAVRLRGLEARLSGMQADEFRHTPMVTPDDLKELSPIDDIRGSVGYRMEAAAELCGRATATALERCGGRG